jgi:hypothetical protein
VCSFVVSAALLIGTLQCLCLASAAARSAPGRTFDVLSFGAAADGVTDDSEVPERSRIQMSFICMHALSIDRSVIATSMHAAT